MSVLRYQRATTRKRQKGTTVFQSKHNYQQVVCARVTRNSPPEIAEGIGGGAKSLGDNWDIDKIRGIRWQMIYINLVTWRFHLIEYLYVQQ